MSGKIRLFHTIMTLLLTACASTPSAKGDDSIEAAATAVTRYFHGQIQRSSLDGSQFYGPKVDSLVKRQISKDGSLIQECVFLEGKSFLTIIQKTETPLKYSVQDSDGYSKGFLIFADGSLDSWSYDIDVLKPMNGKITGNLADHQGAKITSDGRMEVVKVWNQKVLIHEIYEPISSDMYQESLKRLPSSQIRKACL